MVKRLFSRKYLTADYTKKCLKHRTKFSTNYKTIWQQMNLRATIPLSLMAKSTATPLTTKEISRMNGTSVLKAPH